MYIVVNQLVVITEGTSWYAVLYVSRLKKRNKDFNEHEQPSYIIYNIVVPNVSIVVIASDMSLHKLYVCSE